MKSILAVWILIGVLGTLSDDVKARTIMEAKGPFKSVDGKVSCKCNAAEVEYRSPVGEVGKALEAIRDEAIFKGCTECTVEIYCDSSNNSLYACEKLAKNSKGSSSDKDIYMLRDYSAANTRSRRDIENLGACNFPRNLKTSHLSCTEYPNKIKCSQKCIFGHTLDEGISREMMCEFKDNVWKPLGFQECNPFVDCSMTLVATGNKSCQVGTPFLPSVCNVTCGDYEDKIATPLDTFECQVNGGWDKPLPHCVISGSGFALVPPPRVKTHSAPEKDEHKKIIKPQKVNSPQKMVKHQKVEQPKTMEKPQKTESPVKMDAPVKMEASLETDKPHKHAKAQKRVKAQKHIEPATEVAPQHNH